MRKQESPFDRNVEQTHVEQNISRATKKGHVSRKGECICIYFDSYHLVPRKVVEEPPTEDTGSWFSKDYIIIFSR
jgi:hypothetical protein